MKKKTLLLAAVAVMLVATMSIGGMLAYFTDTDSENNTFTVGNVEIDLKETFEQGSKLVPGIDVEKIANVTNTGSEDAYVRVHIAIPSILEDGINYQDASKNLLHFNFGEASVGDGKWNWNKDSDGAEYPGNNGPWNVYKTTIDGIDYNVYVVTYETALATDGKTEDVINKVYLDTKITNDDVTEIKKVLGDNWQIKIIAEGGQAAGFEDAYNALNTQFGNPGEYTAFAATTPEVTE